MTDKEKREQLESKKAFVRSCSTPSLCGVCKRVSNEIARLESDVGTVAPEHRAKSSGALKR